MNDGDGPTRSRADVARSAAGPRLVAITHGAIVMRDLGGRATITVGRAADCEVRLDDPLLSRRHLALQMGPPIEVVDLGSKGGTRMGGLELRAHEPAPLIDGSVIEAGDTLLFVQSTARPAAPVEARPSAIAFDELVGVVAKSELSVILSGETGVGKEVLAERIHRQSHRASRKMLRLNCAAFQENLLESELFGHEKGAFTGATVAKAGLLESASGGTVFLDELGEMPLSTQTKLLRALESHEVLRVGGLVPRPLDVRYIAATNRDLQKQIDEGSFRRDLFFRLDGISLRVPPLRERIGEIEVLARGFVEESARRAGTSPVPISAKALRRLLTHHWPGNIRELRNTLARAFVLARGDAIDETHLLLEPVQQAAPAPLRGDVEDFERSRILAALSECGDNQTRAAELLGISRRTLVSRLTAYGLTKRRGH